MGRGDGVQRSSAPCACSSSGVASFHQIMGWDSFPEAGMGWATGSETGLAVGEEESFEAYVTAIKGLQRSDPEAKDQWAAYVKQAGLSKLDPTKHSGEFLQSFLAQYQSGVRFPPPGSNNELVEGGGSLVAQIKELQRRDPSTNEHWIAYVDLSGQGVRDPAKHSQEFLEAFLTQLQSSQMGTPLIGTGRMQQLSSSSSGEECPHLGESIKFMQKKSTSFKNLWDNFCQQHGGGRYDPTKHEATTHVKFLDFIAAQATAALSMGMSGNAYMMGEGEAPLKRIRDSGMGMGVLGSVSSEKDQAVAQMKAFQRMGQEQKELWDHYSDTYLQGVRDPSRHDLATLQEFMANHHIPPTPLSGLLARGSGGGGGAGPSTMTGLGGIGNSEKMQLVNQVKAFQRMGVEQKDLWTAYADTFLRGVYDPSRHEADILQEFCENHNVPPVSGPLSGMSRPSSTRGLACSENAALVNQVRAFQRLGSEQNELWGFYADTYLQGVRDPSRHDAETLQQFCDSHYVPKLEAPPTKMVMIPPSGRS